MPSERAVDIRREALTLFAERGYDATSIRDIAKAVGLLPGSLYAHITSKEQLLSEIIEQGIDDFLSAMTSAASTTDSAPVRLRRAIRAHLEVIARDRDRTGVVFHQWRSLTGPTREKIVAKRKLYEQQFVDILEEGVRQGTFRSTLDTRFAVLVVLGALNWTPEWFSPGGNRTAEEVADRVSDLLLEGLTAP